MYTDPRGLYPGGGPFEGAEPPPNTGGPWTWHPDQDNSRGGTWRDPKGHSASWDPKGHWDIDDGMGNRQRYDRWGNKITAGQAHNPKRKNEKPIKNWKKVCKLFGPLGVPISVGITLYNDESLNAGELMCDAVWGCEDLQ